MSRSRSTILLVGLVLFILSGCTTASDVTGKASQPQAGDNVSETLKPSGIHEDCMQLDQGQSVDYSFKSSRPVNFNIHYHEDSKVVYSIEKNLVTSDQGSMNIPKKQHYCLMWTNPGSDTANISYTYRVRSAQQ